MQYLLDTDIYIYLMAGNEQVYKKICEIGDEAVYLSSITLAELYFGVFNSIKKEENLKSLRKNLEQVQVFDFCRSSALLFGKLKSELKKSGQPIADMDLAIASIALQNRCTLVTHNQKHFKRIKELYLEDWTLE